MGNPLLEGGVLVCDGGLGSTLSLHGHAVENDPLWSARLLHSDPQAILKVHKEFVAAGADVLITSSYQVSVAGFQSHLNLSHQQTVDLIADSVRLASAATQGAHRRILICGSVGPYGACQGDGSEYTGEHLATMTEEELMDWHRPRVATLLTAGVTLLAVETQPSLKEALAIVRLLREYPGAKAWISFSCQNGELTNAGDNFADSAYQCYNAGGGEGGVVVGVGTNCTAPHNVTPLLDSLNKKTSLPPSEVLPRVVYPNSGEQWIHATGWVSSKSDITEGWRVNEWVERGARVVGGCCRVAPQHIAQVANIVQQIK